MVACGGQGGKERRYLPQQKRFVTGPFEQPARELVCVRGWDVSTTSRLNIGWRVGPRARAGAVIALILFPPLLIRTRHRP